MATNYMSPAIFLCYCDFLNHASPHFLLKKHNMPIMVYRSSIMEYSMSAHSAAFTLWSKLGKYSFGRWLFSRIVCFKAPYFSTVSPTVSCLEHNLCVGYIGQRKSVQNHIGSIHAIALCNLAELCAGLMTDVSIPNGMRWIPKEMTVRYLQKAFGKITARAIPVGGFYESAAGYEATVQVSLTNSEAVEVLSAEIKMWVSKRS